MIRVLAFIRRLPTISRDAFRSHYEEIHVPTALPSLGGITGYVRHHLREEIFGAPGFDCMTPLRLSRRRGHRAAFARIEGPQGDAIRRDELLFMDKPANVFFVVEEAPGWGAPAATGRKACSCWCACGARRRSRSRASGRAFLDEVLPALRAAADDARWCRPQWARPGVAQGAGFDAVIEIEAAGSGGIASWARCARGRGRRGGRRARLGARDSDAGLRRGAMASELGFDAKALLEEAQRRAGASDFGDPAFLEPMQRLLAALEREAELNPSGRLGQQERIVGLLVNRLRTEESVRRHPEILEQRIRAPIVIVGLARTGTTMLHRMLASDPRLHALLWYESRQPAPPPGAGGGAGSAHRRRGARGRGRCSALRRS